MLSTHIQIDPLVVEPSQSIWHKDYWKHEPTLVQKGRCNVNQIQEREAGYNVTVSDKTISIWDSYHKIH